MKAFWKLQHSLEKSCLFSTFKETASDEIELEGLFVHDFWVLYFEAHSFEELVEFPFDFFMIFVFFDTER